MPDDPTPEEVRLCARGIATAVAPPGGLTDVQAALLQAIAAALTGVEVDYLDLEPLGPDELAAVLASRPPEYRHRIVHHMVLGALVLKPLPREVAWKLRDYASALAVDDKFVRITQRYAQRANGLAWLDLQRSGFTQHWEESDPAALRERFGVSAPFEPPAPDTALETRWEGYRALPDGTLGRSVWEMYHGRGFALPGNPAGPSAYLAQHDYVHVLADYGTNLKGELEVFGFIGRADPDPKGFAWLATLVGLFETGYIADTGFFKKDVRERNIQAPGMHHRIADAIRRGKAVSLHHGADLFDFDYDAVADRLVDEVRERLAIPEKSLDARASGSAGVFDREGMSELQKRYVDEHMGEPT